MSRLMILGAGKRIVPPVRYPDTIINTANGGSQDIVTTNLVTDFALLATGTADSRKKITISCHSNGGSSHTHTLTLFPTATDRTNGTNGITCNLRRGQGGVGTAASANYMSVWDAALPTQTDVYARLTLSAASTRVALRAITHARTFIAMDGQTPSNGVDSTALLDVPSYGAAWLVAQSTGGTQENNFAGTLTNISAAAVGDFSSGLLYIAVGQYNNGGVADILKSLTSAFRDTSTGGTANAQNQRSIAVTYGEAA